VLVAVALSCGGGGSSTPTGSSGGPTATPTPAATPTPTPVPAPGSFCALGDGPGDGNDCPREMPHFLDEVETAIDQLAQSEPDIFDLNDQRGAGGYRILSLGRFYVGIVSNLEAMGFCATFDGEEVAVKNSNDFNDQYDLELSDLHVRRGESAYRATCRPAAFPHSQGAPGQTPGCTLPGSRELACGRDPSSHFLPEVESALDAVIRDHPELFDLGETSPGTDWPLVVDIDGYVDAVVQAMDDQGFCARWDGEELQVKDSNDFSDQFDILLAAGYVRRGEGSYRASCYPAAF